MKPKFFTLVLGLLAAVTLCVPVQAQSVLGSNYLETGVNYARAQFPHLKLETYTATIGGYRVVSQNGAFSLGISGNLNVSVDDTRHVTYQAQGLSLSALPNYAITPELKIFGTATAILEHTRTASAPAGRTTDGHVHLGIGAGLEYVIDKFSLIATADYMRFTGQHRENTWVFGGQVNYWLDPNWGIAGGYSYFDYKHGHANRLYARVRYRF